MNNKSLIKKVKNLPVPILPTMVGAFTLSNIYSGMGYTWVRHITAWAAIAVILSYILKICFHFDTVKKAFEPLCTQVNEITTAESFDDVEAK